MKRKQRGKPSSGSRMTRSSAAMQKAINPIIFLDFDGVLVLEPVYDRAAKVCVKHLNYLIEETDAHIVISSAWRAYRTDDDLEHLLRNWGVNIEGRYLGQTPVLRTVRGEEICHWMTMQRLFDHPFVILDDEGDMGAMLPWLVRTKYKTGLTSERAERAIALLRFQIMEKAARWQGRLTRAGLQAGIINVPVSQ